MTYLYIAYAATWLIHVAYLSTVARRYSRLKKEMEQLGRNRK